MKHIKTRKELFLSEGMNIDVMGNLNIPDYLTDNADDDIDSAYEKGKEGFINEYELSDNPYNEADLKDAWETGFLDAKDKNI